MYGSCMDMLKTHKIEVRCGPEEKLRIQRAAKVSGVSTSELMRDAVMNRVKRIERKGETE